MNSRKNTIYKILFRSSAKKELRKLQKDAFETIRDAIDKLAKNSRPPQSRKMVGGDNQWRLRVGDYRVIYGIYDKQLVIEVIRVKHRKDAYRK